MARLRDFLPGFLRRRASPTSTAGSPGFTSYGGYIDHDEISVRLGSHDERYRTFSDILVNTSIIAASVRYYLNLISKAEWSWAPSEADTSGEYAELVEEIFNKDLRTPWHRVVRRAAMYRFYGFSVQEWIARKRDDGIITFDDIRPRPQNTLERWDVDAETGDIVGIIQRRPQDGYELYLPRNKTLYIVDDSLSDNPTGIGLFRHLVEPQTRLKRYLQLEGWGYELDLRNIPMLRAPIAALQRQVQEGVISQGEMNQQLAPLIKFGESHVKNPNLSLLFDSSVYSSTDDAGRPSSTPQYSAELLTGSQTGLGDMHSAIERINREMARIMGTEQMLLGENKGSYALAKDKTGQFYLLVDGALTEIKEQVERDLIDTLWTLNGWPDDMKPETNTEAVRDRDVEQVSKMLLDIAEAGVPLLPDDPVVNQLRDLAGAERMPEESDYSAILESMYNDPTPAADPSNSGGTPSGPGREPDMPEDDE